ncbi:ABC transporter permease [Acuticoccus sp. 2012]|uniref:ABC transporter permease n=1 Tax=Acuticoccus mangrovi TaxID=2796142 RepID=A0A934IL70_9HYPH|nr:ABC transporter permease [Acuticoccus mangrovi]MBJ3778548.1 ABC transporter permease [Acuticoccus mangrovi]
MGWFIARRLGQFLLLLFVMSLVVFVALFALGNPVLNFINPSSPPDVVRQAIHNLGLDQPAYIQYFRFLSGIAHGDLGNSYTSGRPALRLILERLPATLELSLGAMLIATLVGIPLGLGAGYRPNSLVGRFVEGFSLLSVSLPTFWIGLMLIIVFAIETGIFPAGGRGPTTDLLGMKVSFTSLEGLRHLFLPALNLSLFPMALAMRLTRASVEESLRMNFVRYARAKGLPPRRILSVYVLKNVLPSLVTVMGMVLGGLLAFSVITESIFAWPGTGKLVIDAIQISDRPVIIAYLLFTVFIFSTINLLVDIVCAVLDPRISLRGAAS